MSTSDTIGAAGGSIELQGHQGHGSGVTAMVDFPPTALAADTTITLTEMSTPPPAELLDWSPVYRAEPLGVALATPATLRVPWGNLSGVVPSTLAIWFSIDGVCFERVHDSYTNAGFNQGSLERLGYLVVGAPRTTETFACP